jgi:hypothetical protein
MGGVCYSGGLVLFIFIFSGRIWGKIKTGNVVMLGQDLVEALELLLREGLVTPCWRQVPAFTADLYK